MPPPVHPSPQKPSSAPGGSHPANNASTTGSTALAGTTHRRHAEEKEAPQRIQIQLTNTQKKELREAFDLFDSEGTGRIAATEVKVALRALGFEVKKEELRQLLAEVGCQVNRTIDFNEFMNVLLLKAGERETKADVQRAFRNLDVADKGYVSIEDIEQVAILLEQNLTEDELREMMEFAHPKSSSSSAASGGGAPPKKEGGYSGKDAPHVTEEDFMRIMKRANVY